MISFGVAGGLASHLRAGDWVVASSIRESENVQRHGCRVVTEAPWHNSGGSIHAPIVGVDETGRRTGQEEGVAPNHWAAAVDMESASGGTCCRRAQSFLRRGASGGRSGAPAGCRPPLSSACSPDGRANVSLYCATLFARPSQISPLARVAVDAFAARAAMAAGAACARPAFRAGRSRLASGGMGPHGPTSPVRESTSRQARNWASNGASTRRALYLSAKNGVILWEMNLVFG